MSEFFRSTIGRITLVLLIGFIVLAGIQWRRTMPLEFDSQNWKDRREMRPQMVEQMLSAIPFEGMGEANVLELLGSPDHEAANVPNGTKNMLYWTGDDGIDDVWFDVQLFDDRVCRVSVHPD